MKKFKGCINCKYKGDWHVSRTDGTGDNVFNCKVDGKEIKKERVFCKHIDSIGHLRPSGKRKLMKRMLA